jgi:hypothetical protein
MLNFAAGQACAGVESAARFVPPSDARVLQRYRLVA